MINYYLLTKPGIILGNLLTVAAGFILGLQGSFQPSLFLITLLGLALVMASACVFNNYIDRNIDKKMNRTKNRALVNGKISTKNAILFAIILAALGLYFLIKFTNLTATIVAFTGFFVYVILYSLWKRHTIYATAIGSIAGGVPPLVGYCAVSEFDLGALILFAMMVLWQMPHFFAIAIYHFEDYVAASIPAFPIKKGIRASKVRIIFYVACFIVTTFFLTFFGYTGLLFFFVTTFASLVWLIACIKGYEEGNEKHWGKKMFRLSLVTITTICIILPLDHFI